MNEWVAKTIGDICDLGNGKVQTGPFGSQLHQSDYQAEGYPFVMPKDILNGKIDESSIARVSINHVERLSKHKLSLGDIIYGRRGDIGRQALVRRENVGWLCGSGCLRISLGNAPIDPKFLHFYLKLPEVMSWVENQAVGATMPNLNTKILRSVPVLYPINIHHQQKIVAIISAYDDLIENNDRRIALLEKMAEEIYREWFVRLRFPGHEQVTFHKGIPEGWEMVQMDDVIKDIIDYRGVTPGKLNSDWQSEGIIALSALNVKKGKLIRLEDSKRVSEPLFERWMRKKLDRLDILLTSEAPLGEVYILMEEEKYVLSQRLFAIRANSKKIEPIYLYHYLFCEIGQYELTSKATGSTVGGIRQALLRKVEILKPTNSSQKKFVAIAEPILEEIHKLWNKNNLLKQIRDRLLTRLLSGKLSVKDLDIQFPSSMTEL
jgi:type I restriction enzyme, S subunit